MQVDLDDHIPPALYTVVAELLAWLYHIEAEQAAGKLPISSREGPGNPDKT
jgi:flagellar biosynthesis protein